MYKLSILILAFAFTIQAYDLPIPLNTNSSLTKVNVKVEKDEPKVQYRLPSTVKPINYVIKLTPYLEEGTDKSFTFDGEVEIKVNVTKRVQDIIFHAKDLNFTLKNVSVTSIQANMNFSDLTLSFDQKRDFVIINREKQEEISKGVYVIKIKYQGILNDDLRGFYRSSYINDAKQKVWLATTHFEPLGARRAFPCFDEPSFKATFSIKIVHEKNFKAISNTAIEKTSPLENSTKSETIFKLTPPMSTYLVAFVVSDFEMKTHSTDKNFTVGARPNAIQYGDLSLEAGQKLLKALETFLEIPYEMGKMDQVAIPDFAAGAMENWGLVLYTENSLLYNEKVLTTSGKKNIVETIAHEFAHQWFGDLVSPKWWKYLWLNEGFANFFQSFITQKVYPNWHSVEISVVQPIQTSAFNFDSGSTTHPINHDVESPEEISALFDVISYTKAGAVIRMMQHFLTEAVFQKGLKHYLSGNNTNHNAADSDDLFKAIQETVDTEKVNLNILEIMNPWVTLKGYPVLNVVRNNNSNSIEVKQERFCTYNASKEEKNQIWHIPINYASNKKLDFDKTTPDFWLGEASSTFSVDADANSWIILNKQQTGYYRVNYDENNWKLIIEQLSTDHEAIHVLNRAQLINDALAFTQQKQLNLPTLLHLINYLRNETNNIAWYPGFRTFTWFKSKLENTKDYSIFKKFAANVMKGVVESVGLEEGSGEETNYLIKMNRATTIDWACKLEVPLDTPCSTKMQEKLKLWLESPEKNTLSTDVRQVTICNGLRAAEFETWEKVLKKSVSETTDSNEKRELLSALSCSSDKKTLEHFFNYTFEEHSPLENKTLSIVKDIIDNSEVGISVVLDFVNHRLAALLIKANNKTDVFEIVEYLSQKITTADQLEKLEALSDIPKNVKSKAVENAKMNIEWLKENEEIIINTIKQINSGFAIASATLTLILSLLVNVFYF